MLLQALCVISKPSVNSNWSYSPETPNLCQIRRFFSRVTLQFEGWPWKTISKESRNAQFGSKWAISCPMWPWNWTDDIEKQQGTVVSSFMHHFIAISEFKLKLLSGNAQFRSKSTIFLSHVTLKFDVWPWKIIGHLFSATSNFVHHVVAIGAFKLELQYGNTQFRSKLTIFLAVWPWFLTDDLEKQ